MIKCAVYPSAHGTETLGEVIANSCNDAMMQIGAKMGALSLSKHRVCLISEQGQGLTCRMKAQVLSIQRTCMRQSLHVLHLDRDLPVP